MRHSFSRNLKIPTFCAPRDAPFVCFFAGHLRHDELMLYLNLGGEKSLQREMKMCAVAGRPDQRVSGKSGDNSYYFRISGLSGAFCSPKVRFLFPGCSISSFSLAAPDLLNI
ncbi:hypothetical protein CEXT_681901 [Caerostris extrusa]|uniref:Uncharacterized protein n=1 Tax=Caerostris extrusa TaxID=172846 RepID=A0AAV4XME4_CAEEX|nr:hypothetical protein CEXT_681901 [Caerostris extrusa]